MPARSLQRPLPVAARLLSAVAVWLLVGGVPIAAQPAGGVVESAASSRDAELEHGARLFQMLCAECHGRTGDGWGERHDITYARPRSLLKARFKIASTDNLVPSDEDLERTIRRGMVVSGMPSWSQLSDEEISVLARYVRWIGVEEQRRALEARVAAGDLNEERAARLLERRTVPGEPVEVPPEPPRSPERLARGAEIYREACQLCHGPGGHPEQGQVREDFEGNFLVPTSLAEGQFKGGSTGRDLYLRVVLGMDGTAMPSYDGTYSEDDLWAVVHYVQTLSDGAAERLGASSSTILASSRDSEEAPAPSSRVSELETDLPPPPPSRLSIRTITLWALFLLGAVGLLRWLLG